MLAPSVVAIGRRDVCMTDESLHHRDVDASIEEIGNTGPSSVRAAIGVVQAPRSDEIMDCNSESLACWGPVTPGA